MRAYWKGAVVSSTFLAIYFDIILATNLLIKSPTTIPLTPPSGLLSAVIRPKRNLLQTPVHAPVVLLGVIQRELSRNCVQPTIGPRRRAERQQEPRCLHIFDMWDPFKEQRLFNKRSTSKSTSTVGFMSNNS